MDNQQPSVNNSLFYQKPQEGNGFIYRYISPSMKSYIGQTTNTLRSRAQNIYKGTGYKKCTLFWKAICKYGWTNFKIEILEECSIEKLDEKESFYIKKFNSLAPFGYNLTCGGEGGKTKPVFVYSAQNGELIDRYSSLTMASEETGVPIETISLVMLQGSRKQAHNYVFLDSYIKKYDITIFNNNKNTQVYVYDKNGNYLQHFYSAKEASKNLNIGYSSILNCLSGRKIHACYYQFKKDKFDKIDAIPKNKKSPIAVHQIDPATNQIINTYPSLISAAQAVGLSNGAGIKKVVLNGKGRSGGYFWKIDEGSTTKSK